MAFIRCNIFPDGKRGKRTQLAGIQQDINWRSHGSGISNGVWETYHSKCVLFSCGQARHLFTLFSLRVLIQIFTQIFIGGRILFKKKKKKKKVGQIQAQQLSQSFSTAWSLNISALTFDALALFILLFWMKKRPYFSCIWVGLCVVTQISISLKERRCIFCSTQRKVYCLSIARAYFFSPLPSNVGSGKKKEKIKVTRCLR